MSESSIRVEIHRRDEQRAHSVAAASRSASPLEVAGIVAGAFAIPAASAWGAWGLALSAGLGVAMWLFERSRRRDLERESLVRIWRLIENACSLEDVRNVAHDAVADFLE